ncbi:MAG: flagellar protein FlgN [Bacteriovoracia bacterium]
MNDRKSAEIAFALDKLIGLHRALLELLVQEYSYVVTAQTEQLVEVTQSKQQVLGEILNAEHLRIEAASRLLKTLGLPSTASISEINQKIGDKEARDLNLQKEVLTELILRSKEQNKINMEFVRQSLDRIDVLKRNALGVNNTSNENYSDAGKRQPIPTHGGRLLSTEV